MPSPAPMAALKTEGFGVISWIDIQQTLKSRSMSNSGHTRSWELAIGRQGRTDAALQCYRSGVRLGRSEEHTSELQSLMRISYAVFCLKKKKNNKHKTTMK